jgi:hypothetical protein
MLQTRGPVRRPKLTPSRASGFSETSTEYRCRSTTLRIRLSRAEALIIAGGAGSIAKRCSATFVEVASNKAVTTPLYVAHYLSRLWRHTDDRAIRSIDSPERASVRALGADWERHLPAQLISALEETNANQTSTKGRFG